MIEWTEPALADLTAALHFVAQDDPEAARRTGTRIHKACLRLTQFPGIGRQGLRAGTRELVLRGLPFITVYKVVRADIYILRLLHTSREWPD